MYQISVDAPMAIRFYPDGEIEFVSLIGGRFPDSEGVFSLGSDE